MTFIADAKWCLDRVMVTGRYSAQLVVDFDSLVESRSGNVFPIFDEIAGLEGSPNARGKSQTKGAAPFKGQWLSGLWHKHYTQAGFMARNLVNHWSASGRFEALWSQISTGRQAVDEAAIKILSHRMVHDGYLERGQRSELTGEWIVFAKQAGRNYYLTLGVHGEDEAIWRRCKACANEFPELIFLKEGG